MKTAWGVYYFAAAGFPAPSAWHLAIGIHQNKGFIMCALAMARGRGPRCLEGKVSHWWARWVAAELLSNLAYGWLMPLAVYPIVKAGNYNDTIKTVQFWTKIIRPFRIWFHLAICVFQSTLPHVTTSKPSMSHGNGVKPHWVLPNPTWKSGSRSTVPWPS